MAEREARGFPLRTLTWTLSIAFFCPASLCLGFETFGKALVGQSSSLRASPSRAGEPALSRGRIKGTGRTKRKRKLFSADGVGLRGTPIHREDSPASKAARFLLRGGARTEAAVPAAVDVSKEAGGQEGLLAEPEGSPMCTEGMSEADVLERISLRRYANKKFDGRSVPPEALRRMLAQAQRAPSGFNVQPWKAVVVTSQESKQRLSKAMLDVNAERVLECGAVVVFAADLEVMREKRRFMAILEKDGLPKKFVRKVPLYVSIFSTGHRRPFRLPLLMVKRLAFGIVRRLGFAMPSIGTAETWAFKNTMLAVQELMLAASAHGLKSCPMEGFDQQRLRKALHLPGRYSCPVVVALGYSPAEEVEEEKKKEEESEEGGLRIQRQRHKKRRPSRRYQPEEVYFAEEWGRGMEGITPSDAAFDST